MRDDATVTAPRDPLGAHCCTWAQFGSEQPEIAAAVATRFESAKHHVLATLRRDGSPRVSGTEVAFVEDSMWIGSMWRAVKALDLRRDPRFALHANTGDGSMEGGDAKVSGIAVEVAGAQRDHVAAAMGAPEGDLHLFRLDLEQVVLSEVDHTRECMVIRSWRPDRGLIVTER
jgi:hypothetical protein